MTLPDLQKLFDEHAAAFALPDTSVFVQYAHIEAALTAQGITIPHLPMEPRRVSIFIDAELPTTRILPVLLHELIHAEQFALTGIPAHDAYFSWRVAELRAAGLPVVDARGHMPRWR